MKKIIYGNLISIITLIILPWFIFIQEDSWNVLSFNRNYLFIIVFIGAILLFGNIRNSIKSKGGERAVSILFVIPPALVILYFVLGYIAFSRFTIL